MGLLVSHLYLLLIALGMCVLYVVFLRAIPLFFNEHRTIRDHISLWSIAQILLLYTIVVALVFSIRDIELGNRLLHSIGGGFAMFMVCYLSIRDSRLAIGPIRFFFFSLLVVTSLGVVNELAEFLIEQFVEFEFARGAYDTWLDLLSNTVGLLLAASLFVPLFWRGQKKKIETPPGVPGGVS